MKSALKHSPGKGIRSGFMRLVLPVHFSLLRVSSLVALATLLIGPRLPAVEIFIWSNEERTLALTDAQLEEDKARGVRGFVCGMGQLPFTEVKARKCEATVKPLADKLHR